MAWVADRGQRTFVEADWPEDLQRPERPAVVAGETPAMFAAVMRERAEAVLKVMVGGKYADTGRVIAAATPVDIQFAKVRLTLEPEPAGHCSLIR